MDDEYSLAGACGLHCGACGSFGTECDGCGAQAGSVFWGECELYLCCVEERGLDFCGECDEYPCHMYLQAIEHPTFPPREDMISAVQRRLEIGVEAWLEEQTQDDLETL